MATNTPVHSPLYPTDLAYGSDDCESVSVLARVDEAGLRDLLGHTPFEFVSPHAWLEALVLRSATGVAPFSSAGIIFPAKFGDVVGGYYAFCYIDTDDGLALGREPFGYPKKLANVRLQRTGQAAIASMESPHANFELSVVIDESVDQAPAVPRYPHLLYQLLPSAETPTPLLERVISRDTSVGSNFTTRFGHGAFDVSAGALGNEIAVLVGATPMFGAYARGEFRSAYGSVLSTISLGAEISDAVTKTSQ